MFVFAVDAIQTSRIFLNSAHTTTRRLAEIWSWHAGRWLIFQSTDVVSCNSVLQSSAIASRIS